MKEIIKNTIKEAIFFVFEVVKIVFIALVIVMPIRYFVFQPFIVKGISMEPNFHDGDYLIVDEATYRLRQPERGEVVVFRFSQGVSQRFIKRIIGLPGEEIEIENGQIIITDKLGSKQVLDELNYLPSQTFGIGDMQISLGKDEYFVLGDNRFNSYDSRKWGALQKEDIIGRALFRLWPPTAAAYILTPSY